MIAHYFKALTPRGRAVVHAKAIRSMLADPEKRPPGTFGAQWYEEAGDTLDALAKTQTTDLERERLLRDAKSAALHTASLIERLEA